MAGSWLKMRHDLIDAPEIRRLARRCGVTKDDVLGKLFRLWSWFDRHSVGGRVEDDDIDLVDEVVGHQGFAAALVSVGWLANDSCGIVIPNWERHNSETAKQRAQGAARVAEHRSKTREKPPCNGDVTLDALPDGEGEGEGDKELPPLPREGFDREAWGKLRDAWNASGVGKPWKAANPPPPAVERLSDPDWLASVADGLAKLRTVKFFRTPVTLRQFCGADAKKGVFLDRLVSGEFDDVTPPARVRGDDKPPVREFDAAAKQAIERTRRALEAKRAS